MEVVIVPDNKSICKIICIVFILCLVNNSVSGQVQIDSFIKKVYSLRMGKLLEKPLDIESGINKIAKGDSDKNYVGGIFKVRDHIPVTQNCEGEPNGKLRIRCAEKFLSKHLVKRIDSLELNRSYGICKAISCRITINYIGKMTNIEVLTQVDENIRTEIIKTIDLLRKNYVYWTAQSSNTQVRAIYIYMTINLVEIMSLKYN